METVTYQRLAKLPRPDQTTVTTDQNFGLIVPPSHYIVPCGWEWVKDAPFEGPSIIASLLKGLGYQFHLLDQRKDFQPSKLTGKLKKFDYIGIATYEDNFPYIKKVVEVAKKENPDCPVILGGPLVTSAPELLLKNTKADYAVVGEGELTLIELMDYLRKNEYALPLKDIKGLAWKNKNGKVSVNAPREQMKNLDAVPFQDFSVWDRFKGKDIPEIYLSYSRGCIGNCAFCFRPMPKLSYKSVNRVKREIEFLKHYNFKMAWWNDLTFCTDKKYVHKLLDKALTVHKFRWSAFNRVNMVNLPLLKHMKKRGCDIILYGFESISQGILNSYRKGITKNFIVNAIHKTRKAGIKCGGLFIVGAIDETKESIENLISFCREFKEVTRVKYLSALPGTPLYRQAIKEGYIKDEVEHLNWLARERSDEEDIDRKGFILFSKNITKEDLRYAYHTVNTMIEVRPYDYGVSKNIYLSKPKKFKKVN